MIAKPRKARKKTKKAVKRSAAEAGRLQYAALPWRVADGALEIMLVSSRETKRWIIPKGWPMSGRSGAAAAAIEAMEEAGLLGIIAEEPCGHFTYSKRFSRGEELCKVEVFPLRSRASVTTGRKSTSAKRDGSRSRKRSGWSPTRNSPT